MAISKPAIRNKVLYGNLSGMLWNGKTDQAVKYLSELPESAVKNKAHLKDVIDYLNFSKKYTLANFPAPQKGHKH